MSHIFWGMVSLSVAAGLFFLMWRGWQGIKRRSEAFQPWDHAHVTANTPVQAAEYAPAAEVLGESAAGRIAAVPATHLATAHRGRPLERVLVGKLGHRAAGRLTLTAEALIFEHQGQTTIIPESALRQVRLSSWAIDRGAPINRILVIAWQPPQPATVLESYFLIPNKKKRLELVQKLSEISREVSIGE